MRIWRCTIADTVEQKLLALQERKRALADAALRDDGGEEGGGGKLTIDDLTNFFR